LRQVFPSVLIFLCIVVCLKRGEFYVLLLTGSNCCAGDISNCRLRTFSSTECSWWKCVICRLLFTCN
jgi:hypothetical protein